MALVDDRTMTMDGKPSSDKPSSGNPSSGNPSSGNPIAGKRTSEKKVFLLTAFACPDPMPPLGTPVTGTAENVLAVIGMSGQDGKQRFEWVGDDAPDSIARPALVTPVKVRLALASPWHPEADRIMTGLVQLAPEQLGDGPVDDDVDHLLLELAASRAERGPAAADQDVVNR